MNSTRVKSPPHSIEDEQAVLGACLLDERALDDCRAVLREEHFFRQDHRLIWRALCAVQDAGEAVDHLTVRGRLEGEQPVDPAYLIELVESVPATSNAESYARRVRSLWHRRSVISAAGRIEALAWDRKCEDFLERAQAILSDQVVDGTAGPVSMSDSLRSWAETLDRRVTGQESGLRVGFRDLDRRWGGLRPGNLAIIAGRPAMGKTTLGLAIAENVALAGGTVLVFSLEMTRTELNDRSIARFSEVSQSVIRAGKVGEHDFPKVLEAAGKLQDLGLYIDDSSDLHIAEIRARARRQHRRTPLSLVVIDYLQLVRGDGDNQNLRVADVSRQAKAMAKELGVPVLLISQLSRASEQRVTERRPMLSDLRDSGAIEQDADLVAMVHRQEVYDEKTPRKGLVEVITRKFRAGEPGTDFLRADLACSRLLDVEEGFRPPPSSAARRGEDDL